MFCEFDFLFEFGNFEINYAVNIFRIELGNQIWLNFIDYLLLRSLLYLVNIFIDILNIHSFWKFHYKLFKKVMKSHHHITYHTWFQCRFGCMFYIGEWVLLPHWQLVKCRWRVSFLSSFFSASDVCASYLHL